MIRQRGTSDPRLTAEGTIDPWLKTLSFWDGDRPLLALSCYATHPMSHYGQGHVSSDFVGLARKQRQKEEPAKTTTLKGPHNSNILSSRPSSNLENHACILPISALYIPIPP